MPIASSCIDPQARERFEGLMRSAGRVQQFETRVRNADGRVLSLLVSATPIDHLGQPCLIVMSQDITEHRRLEAEQQARAAAEALSRTKSEFIAQLSHELRTPLNAVLGFAHLLANDAELPPTPRQRRQIRSIQEAGRHLLALTNDVLDIARIEAGQLRVEPRRLELLPLVDEVLALLQPQAAQGSVSLAPTPRSAAWVQADPLRLRQVLVNLVGNAIKYNRAGGRVCIKLEPTGPELALHVIDDGMGMTAGQVARLFEPYNRLGREASAIEGTGLGMTLTRALVKAMAGRLSVTSAPDAGTTVTLHLPAAAAPAEAQQPLAVA